MYFSRTAIFGFFLFMLIVKYELIQDKDGKWILRVRPYWEDKLSKPAPNQEQIDKQRAIKKEVKYLDLKDEEASKHMKDRRAFQRRTDVPGPARPEEHATPTSSPGSTPTSSPGPTPPPTPPPTPTSPRRQPPVEFTAAPSTRDPTDGAQQMSMGDIFDGLEDMDIQNSLLFLIVLLLVSFLFWIFKRNR